MAGYCIGLFKYMRVDENLHKKQKLIENRKNIVENIEKEIDHKKFLAYGEFDRIGFEKIVKFSRYREVSEQSKIWVGDRQILLAYDIPEDVDADEVFYNEGDFYIKEEKQMVRSEQLFLGVTILQFKDSQKRHQNNMNNFLCNCKKNIIKLVSKEMPCLKCSILGTLGSFGLVIIWLADQYTDVLRMVTKIRNTDIGNGTDKSIFLSAYTIFAQNHRFGKEWDKKIKEIRGEAALRLTLKRGASEKILEFLKKWQISQSEIYHSAGEYDIVIRMKSADTFNLFSDEGELESKSDFVKENVLQSNLLLCEDIRDNNNEDFGGFIKSQNQNRENNEQKEEERTLQKLKDIQIEYKDLRGKIKILFPNTAGMTDTLDWLYSDYISKISTASNEMWVSNFSYQFLTILHCLSKFVENLDKMKMRKKDVLQIINDLLSDFERQISHIAESNNLVLGTPVCQFRYSGQNNLTLYCYFGIIKNILKNVYQNQEVSNQSEIVPLIVADIIPIIKSDLFINYNNKDDARVITINLPMMSLYDPVCYYPYLLHEIFHYVVPKDRHIRNELLGCLISIEMLNSICKNILMQKSALRTAEEREQLKTLYKDCILPRSYSFMLDYYEKNMKAFHDKSEKNFDVDKVTLTANEYEQKIFTKWLNWINNEDKLVLGKNPIYLFLDRLFSGKKDLKEEMDKWYEVHSDDKKILSDSFILEILDTVDSFGGVVDNKVYDSMEKNFTDLMSCVGEEVFDSSVVLIDAVKEALVDIDMVSMGNMEFPEYLLLFTKIKRELLLDCKEKNADTQDIIRIGMVLDFLCEKKESEIYLGILEGTKEAFVDMYCGLYYSAHKAEADEEVVHKLCDEAEKWFSYWRTCYQNYVLCYRVYAILFRKLWEQSLNIIDVKKNSENMYWKKYAEEYRNYGYYIRNNIMKNPEQWKEKREDIDNKIFNLNIELIHNFQDQESFSDLNEIREKRIDQIKDKEYKNQEYSFEEFKISKIVFRLSRTYRHKFSCVYEIEDVGQLGDFTAFIAEELKKSSNRLLGKNEYPIWYRGQQSEEYLLIPSIMRKYKMQKAKQKRPEDFSLVHFMRKEFEEFRFRADGFEEAIERVGYTEGDYIALMQHYSVASNFLDWTEDALSALYFALEGFLDDKAEKTDKSAALYIFSPALYNHARKNMIMRAGGDKRKLGIEKDIFRNVQEGIPNLAVSFNKGKYDMYLLGKEEYEDDNSVPYESLSERDKKLPFYLPIAIYIPRLNKRIHTQNGNFLAYNIYTSPDSKDKFDYISLERIQEYYFENFSDGDDTEISPFLYKIIIKKEEREKIALWVKAFGMSKEKCYPELSSIGERIMK